MTRNSPVHPLGFELWLSKLSSVKIQVIWVLPYRTRRLLEAGVCIRVDAKGQRDATEQLCTISNIQTHDPFVHCLYTSTLSGMLVVQRCVGYSLWVCSTYRGGLLDQTRPTTSQEQREGCQKRAERRSIAPYFLVLVYLIRTAKLSPTWPILIISLGQTIKTLIFHGRIILEHLVAHQNRISNARGNLSGHGIRNRKAHTLGID